MKKQSKLGNQKKFKYTYDVYNFCIYRGGRGGENGPLVERWWAEAVLEAPDNDGGRAETTGPRTVDNQPTALCLAQTHQVPGYRMQDAGCRREVDTAY